ncbi:MAG: DUF6320 domain-containing protein [Bacteroidota bacterium]
MTTAIQKENNISNKSAFVISVLFLLLATMCLIINYSVNRTISWALFPTGALIVTWATVIPLLTMKKYKSLGMFAGLTVTIIPFLFLIEYLSGEKGWAIPLALPIAGLSLLALAISLFGFAYFKFNKFYPIALTIFLFGVAVNFAVGIIIDRFLNKNSGDEMARVSTIALSLALSLILLIAGWMKRNNPKAGNVV